MWWRAEMPSGGSPGYPIYTVRKQIASLKTRTNCNRSVERVRLALVQR